MTSELLQKWEAIREKYLPDGDTYKKHSILKKLACLVDINVDEFEKSEREEERLKYNFYMKRSKVSIKEMISMS